jgi:hypothetical protein
MPEENDQAASDAAIDETIANAAEDVSGDQTPDEKKEADDAAAAEADAIAKKAEEDNKEPEVRTRKTAKDFIIERQQKKLEKANAKKADDEDGGDGSSDDDIDEEDEKVIKKVASKMFAPIIEKQIAEEDETEVQQFVANNPDFKPYEAKVKVFMKHPSRRELPIESIFYEVAGKDLLKLGAARSKAADDEARENSAGGGDGGGEDTKVKVEDMTQEEFTAYKNSLNLRR